MDNTIKLQNIYSAITLISTWFYLQKDKERIKDIKIKEVWGQEFFIKPSLVISILKKRFQIKITLKELYELTSGSSLLVTEYKNKKLTGIGFLNEIIKDSIDNLIRSHALPRK